MAEPIRKKKKELEEKYPRNTNFFNNIQTSIHIKFLTLLTGYTVY